MKIFLFGLILLSVCCSCGCSSTNSYEEINTSSFLYKYRPDKYPKPVEKEVSDICTQ
jgi:hypothetical protein